MKLLVFSAKDFELEFLDRANTQGHLVHYTKHTKNMAVLTGYEMELSRKLKCGSDIWLNNPRITREASGTSGMTAAMNGSVNVSTNDGWIPEFVKDGRGPGQN